MLKFNDFIDRKYLVKVALFKNVFFTCTYCLKRGEGYEINTYCAHILTPYKKKQ